MRSRGGFAACARLSACLLWIGCGTTRLPPPDVSGVEEGASSTTGSESVEEPVIRSGTLTRDERWTGIVIVTRELVVPEGRTLTIAPNTRVQFTVGVEPSSKILVEGNVYAEGDFQRPILFTAEGPTKQWHGILLEDGSSARFTDVHFQFEANVLCRTSSARFTSCQFSDNSSAVLAIEASSPTIEDSVFRSNVVAIRCSRQAAPEILNNTIVGNIYGIVCEDGSQPTIARNVIANNRQHGIVAQGASSPHVTSNNIVRNGGYAVLDGGRLSDNFIQGNRGAPPGQVEMGFEVQSAQVFGVEEVISSRSSPVVEAGDRRMR